MRCPKCNAQIPNDARFCTECGANLQLAGEDRRQMAQAATSGGFALGQAARQARMETFVDPDAIISERAYNAILIGVVVWGLLVNVFLCAFVGDVTNYISPSLFLIIYLVSVFAGIAIASRSKNPAVSFLGYNMVVVPFGLAISMVVSEYGGLESEIVRDAFMYTLIITLGMLGLVMMFPRFFSGLGGTLFTCLISFVICEGILLIFRIPQNVTDWIAAGLFSLYIAYDIYRSQQFPKTVDNAVDSALDIYLDIANIFVRVLSILSKKKD